MNVADYVLTRLHEHGVRHLIGIPGTSCAPLFDAAPAAGIEVVLTSNELEAGYAADGCARLGGLSAVSVSYGVGTLSLVNAIAGAYVERSPVVVLNGGPSARDDWRERRHGVLFSHSTGRPRTDLRVFEQVTAAAARVDRAEQVAAAFDALLATALREHRPVYFEVPNDLWRAECAPPAGKLQPVPPAPTPTPALIAEIRARLARAKRPAVLVGVEIDRRGLAGKMRRFLDASGLLWATTLLGKATLPEDGAGFVGAYDGDLAPKPVREVVEGADLLLAFGVCFGIDHATLVEASAEGIVRMYDDRCAIGSDVARPADLEGILDALTDGASAAFAGASASRAALGGFEDRRAWTGAVAGVDQAGISHEALFAMLDRTIAGGDWAVVIDTCLGSYPAADLRITGESRFIGNPVWLSIGHSLGAAIGAWLATGLRPLVVIGDGGFQMIAQALSTLARLEVPAVIVLIDNGTYAIEQFLIDPAYFKGTAPALPYVGLHRWDYPGLARSLGIANAAAVADPAALQRRLDEAAASSRTSFISVRVPPDDLPPENRTAIEQPGSVVTLVPVAGEGFAADESVLTLGEQQVVVTARVAREARRVATGGFAQAPHLVVQKGRAFQHRNPDVEVLIDRGRYLVVDLPPGAKVPVDVGCYAIRPLGGGGGFRHAARAAAARDPAIAATLEAMTTASLHEKLKTLSDLHTRHSLEPGFVTALEHCEGWLAAAGCAVQRMSVTMPGGTTFNLVGERAGTAAERGLLIVGAHLDSVNHDGGRDARAPGADDNASGSVATCAIAAGAHGHALQHDVRFILFGGEEAGLLGSLAYVDALTAEDRARLLGVINMDMVASRNTQHLSVLLEGAEVSRDLVDELATLAATYTTLQVQTSFEPYASDHVPFIRAGLPAVLTIEGADGAYEHEHTARDTLDRCDLELMREITRLNLAWVLTRGGRTG